VIVIHFPIILSFIAIIARKSVLFANIFKSTHVLIMLYFHLIKGLYWIYSLNSVFLFTDKMNVNSVLILRIYLKDLRWWKHSFSWVWVSCRISWSIKTRLTVVYQEYRIILLLDSIFVFCKNKIKREREREWDHIPQEIIITNMIKTITSFPNFKKVDGYLQDIKNDQVQETLIQVKRKRLLFMLSSSIMFEYEWLKKKKI